MIIDHDHPAYKKKWDALGMGRYNGAFYYSKEIVKNIIPNVDTDRNWVTILVPNTCVDHSNKRWRILDNKDAAKILQEKLDEIEGSK